MADETKRAKNNLRVLEGILINGEHTPVGTVVSKDDFANKADWQNLAYSFDPPRLVETSDPVGPAEAPAKASAKLPVVGQ